MTEPLPKELDLEKYKIPGGMLCAVCGLRYYDMSYGGPGICPACDCGFTGATLIEAQKNEIERLRREIEVLRSSQTQVVVP